MGMTFFPAGYRSVQNKLPVLIIQMADSLATDSECRFRNEVLLVHDQLADIGQAGDRLIQGDEMTPVDEGEIAGNAHKMFHDEFKKDLVIEDSSLFAVDVGCHQHLLVGDILVVLIRREFVHLRFVGEEAAPAKPPIRPHRQLPGFAKMPLATKTLVKGEPRSA